ncbi:MAG: FGGY family carbohydrate kinase [Actinobacteria bacterium]|nr:FGGY family carbohydrate kinase [Actinomycetota bacterium]
MSVLVIDVGTSGLRSAIVTADATVGHVDYQAFAPSTPAPGLVEFDAMAMGQAVLQVANATLAATTDRIDAVGISTQRASTVVWDRATGEPVGPALGWQDLRTVFDCIMAKADHGLALAPNQSATKLAWLLNTYDPDRSRDLLFGTIDCWIAWVVSGGSLHITDHTNAAVTGLYDTALRSWSTRACEALNIPLRMLPTIVDSSGELGAATALPGAPMIGGLAGDQQASLLGQGCVRPGQAKITFGTGGMLDLCTGSEPPRSSNRSSHGTFPIVAWTRNGEATWGVEAIMLSAGTNVEWLRDDLGIIATAADSHTVASQCDTTDGVVYVPALLGLGTPRWDYGARGALFGITRGTGRAHIVRAVLEGIAQRGADLVEAAEADTGLTIPALRIDGGMSENPTFTQALANATGRPVEVSPVTEATTLGAGYLAGLAAGTWTDLNEVADSWSPALVVEPNGSLDRQSWQQAIERSTRWIPDLSALDF